MKRNITQNNIIFFIKSKVESFGTLNCAMSCAIAFNLCLF